MSLSKDYINELRMIDPAILLTEAGLNVSSSGSCQCPDSSHNDEHYSAKIYYSNRDGNEFPKVYCFVDDKTWNTLELYAELNNLDANADFIEIVNGLGKYLDKSNDIEYKAQLPKVNQSKTEFKTVEEEQLYIKKLFNSTLQTTGEKVENIDIARRKYGKSYIDTYLQKRGLSYDLLKKTLRDNDVSLYHYYDKEKRNSILYKVKKPDGNYFCVQKRIDKYLSNNDNIYGYKGNIGTPEPTYFKVEPLENQQIQKLIICEGMEDAFTALINNPGDNVISLNSTNQIGRLKEILPEIYNNEYIIIAFDNDETGLKATNEMLDFFKTDMNLKPCTDFEVIKPKNNDINEDWCQLLKSNCLNEKIDIDKAIKNVYNSKKEEIPKENNNLNQMRNKIKF